MKHIFALSLLSIIFSLPLDGKRSPYRVPEKNTPTIVTRWVDSATSYSLRDSHIREAPMFTTFDKAYFEQHHLPPLIKLRGQNATVDATTINSMIEELLREIRAKKTIFKDFDVIKMRDFNHKDMSGLVVVKFKKYPLILKLFIENPQSFVRPYDKGFEPTCFFVSGNGSSRHITGFTRVKHAETIAKLIANNEHWSTRITLPRKWFWSPAHQEYLQIQGINIVPHHELSVTVPAVYGIIADEIIPERLMSLASSKDRTECIAIANFLGHTIDAHMKNFFVEKGTGKIAIIDTEHFPSLMGVTDTRPIKDYFSFYTRLAKKFCHDLLFRSKAERMSRQSMPLRV